jgi:hypothetical protein
MIRRIVFKSGVLAALAILAVATSARTSLPECDVCTRTYCLMHDGVTCDCPPECWTPPTPCELQSYTICLESCPEFPWLICAEPLSYPEFECELAGTECGWYECTPVPPGPEVLECYYQEAW